MIKKHYSTALTVTCVVLGVIIGVQANTVKQQRVSTENQRLSEAIVALYQMQAERDRTDSGFRTVSGRWG